MLYCIMLCYMMSYYFILCSIVLSHIKLYCTISYSTTAHYSAAGRLEVHWQLPCAPWPRLDSALSLQEELMEGFGKCGAKVAWTMSHLLYDTTWQYTMIYHSILHIKYIFQICYMDAKALLNVI